jgi:hypothetical protein
MDESAGEARCRGYLKTVAKNKKKKWGKGWEGMGFGYH